MYKILQNDILIILGRALACLIDNDSNLLSRKVKEEAVNHRLAVYIENLLGDNYKWLNVDVEYNKNYDNKKELTFPDGKRQFVRPDILVHSRGDNYNNVLVVECKLHRMDRHCLEKLRGFKKEPYCYANSVGLVYSPDKDTIRLYLASEDDIVSPHQIRKVQLSKWSAQCVS